MSMSQYWFNKNGRTNVKYLRMTSTSTALDVGDPNIEEHISMIIELSNSSVHLAFVSHSITLKRKHTTTIAEHISWCPSCSSRAASVLSQESALIRNSVLNFDTDSAVRHEATSDEIDQSSGVAHSADLFKKSIRGLEVHRDVDVQ